MEDVLHILRLLLEFVTAVAAIYAGKTARANGQATKEVKAELEVNPVKTVNAMAQANGPLSGVLCRYKEEAKQLMPGESPPNSGRAP